MALTSSHENIQNILKPQKICTASCGHWIDTIKFFSFLRISQKPRLKAFFLLPVCSECTINFRLVILNDKKVLNIHFRLTSVGIPATAAVKMEKIMIHRRVYLYILGGRHYPNWGQSRVGLIIIFLNNNRNNGTTDKKDKIKYVLYLTSTFLDLISDLSRHYERWIFFYFFGFLEIMKMEF